MNKRHDILKVWGDTVYNPGGDEAMNTTNTAANIAMFVAKSVLADAFMRGRAWERADKAHQSTASVSQEFRVEVERLTGNGLPAELLRPVLGRAFGAGRKYQRAIHDHGPMSAQAGALCDAWSAHLAETVPKLAEAIDDLY